jgi:hypothetical protein
MALSPQQPRAAAAILTIIATVAAVITTILTPITAIVTPILSPVAPPADQPGSISSQSHDHAPFDAA